MVQYVAFWIGDVSYIVTRYFIFAGVAFVLFYLLIGRFLWSRKIQKKWPRFSDYRRDLFFSLLSVTVFASVTFYVLDVGRPHTSFYQDISEYGVFYYIFSWVWMFVLHDTYFYWIHRFMHRPAVYRRIHFVHHRSTNPSPWTAYAFHPLEAILEVGIVPLMAYSLPLHINAFAFFFLFQIFYNVYGHLGFELYPRNFHRTWVGRWINTSVAHNYHHKKFEGNYGFYFLFWDRVMGTLRPDYEEAFDDATTRRVSD